MSNKRIDLTQFEGHIEKLRLDDHFQYYESSKTRSVHLHIVVPPNKPVGVWNEWKGGLIFDLGEKAAMGEAMLPTAKAMAASPDLIAELKRCYEREDYYKSILSEVECEGWTATCKADGEGECRLHIETVDELIELVENKTVEIPEYSHSSDELCLYEEHCTCGVSHEEWLESKN